MKIAALFVTAAALSGCASSKQIYLPSGQHGYAIRCDGNSLSWNSCYERAGRQCAARGYTIIDKREENSSSVMAGQYGLIGGDNIHRSLMIACN